MAEHFVEVIVVQLSVDELFQGRQLMIVAHKTDGIEFGRLQNDLDLVVVAVHPATGMLWRQTADNMGRWCQ